MHARWATLAAICGLLYESQVTRGGTIRYELTELLGEHRYDGNRHSFGSSTIINTPFGFNSASQARLVIEGTIMRGRARGDGVIREAFEFDLLPCVSAAPTFARSIKFEWGSIEGGFRIDEVYENPFHPETTPLPNPDGYPPIYFGVQIRVRPAASSQWPPAVDSQAQLLTVEDGIVVDVPIVAHVTSAYIELQGRGIPEPDSGVLCAVGVVFGVIAWWLGFHRNRLFHSNAVGQ